MGESCSSTTQPASLLGLILITTLWPPTTSMLCNGIRLTALTRREERGSRKQCTAVVANHETLCPFCIVYCVVSFVCIPIPTHAQGYLLATHAIWGWICCWTVGQGGVESFSCSTWIVESRHWIAKAMEGGSVRLVSVIIITSQHVQQEEDYSAWF